MNALVVTRALSLAEFPNIERDLAVGEVVYPYMGCTYGCIADENRAVTIREGRGEFFEIPSNAVTRLEGEGAQTLLKLLPQWRPFYAPRLLS